MGKNVLIVGALGNMGQRYSSILRYLEIPFWGYDPTPGSDFVSRLAETSHVIIASPTNTHLDIINMIKVLKPDMHILCEKPISKDLDAIQTANMVNVFMVNNYQYTSQAKSGSPGHVLYDYYNSGGDGLGWDCIQLFKFGDDITLSNDSPIWDVEINGEKLSKDQIDQSYIDMIKDFLGAQRRLWDLRVFWKLHKKVHDYEDRNRNSSPNWQH